MVFRKVHRQGKYGLRRKGKGKEIREENGEGMKREKWRRNEERKERGVKTHTHTHNGTLTLSL